MKYSKPALTREQQADLLISRGMLGDRDPIISQLSAVSPLCDLRASVFQNRYSRSREKVAVRRWK